MLGRAFGIGRALGIAPSTVLQQWAEVLCDLAHGWGGMLDCGRCVSMTALPIFCAFLISHCPLTHNLHALSLIICRGEVEPTLQDLAPTVTWLNAGPNCMLAVQVSRHMFLACCAYVACAGPTLQIR